MPQYIAVGDIHGMSDLLSALLEKLPDEGELVFLGDYLDRGWDSPGLIDILIALAQSRPCVFLRGNHEMMALGALAGNEALMDAWLLNGGDETLRQYGGQISDEHRAFLSLTRFYYETDDYIFVHSGLTPGMSAADTLANDPVVPLWTREPFLESAYDWGKRVIHGHSPTVPDFYPEEYPNRINIDTGAVFGGLLTAVMLPEVEYRCVSTD